MPLRAATNYNDTVKLTPLTGDYKTSRGLV